MRRKEDIPMLNTNPTHLTEGDFSRYLDGQADGEMTEHVSQCAQCQSQVESLRRVGAALHEVDALDRCPTTGTLLAFLEGDADGGLAARIGLHVEYCDTVRRRLTIIAVSPSPSSKRTS